TALRGALLAALTFAPPEGAPFRLAPAFVPYENHSNAGESTAITRMAGAGVCVLDFDMDGAWDLFFPDRHLGGTASGSRLYRGGGALSYEDVTERAGIADRGWSFGCAVADVDNDGDSDLYLTRLGRNALYRNRGDGTFIETNAGVEHDSWSTGAAFADLDLDGFPDLYVCSYIDLTRVDLRARCRYFAIEVFCGPNGLPGARDALYRNESGLRFEDRSDALVEPEDSRGFSVLLVDLDSDRLPEIRVANDASMQILYRNLGGFRFEDVSLVSGAGYSGLGMEQSGMGAAAGDYDSDGDEDLYVTNFQRDYNTLFRNDGELSFQDVTGAAGLALPTLSYLAWGAHFLDVGNDGVLDLFVANGHIYPELDSHPEVGEPYAQRAQLFLGDGGGRFDEATVAEDAPARLGRGTAIADLDGNGALDVLVNNLGGSPDLYLAEGGAENWVRLRLAGTTSNRDGLGAVAFVGTTRRELRLSDGFLGSNEPILHFGAGDLSVIPELEVVWPSGTIERCHELPAGRTHVIKEGVGCLP
ncbi:MAG: CRTAC1 family protein, partial [Vicinamibacteria bacterium]